MLQPLSLSVNSPVTPSLFPSAKGPLKPVFAQEFDGFSASSPLFEGKKKKAAKLEAKKAQGVLVEKFLKLVERIEAIGASLGLMEWDQGTYMPEGASEGRPSIVASLSELQHELTTSRKMGKLLKALNKPKVFDRLSKQNKILVDVIQDDYEQSKKLSSSLVERLAKAEGEGYTLWAKAKQETGDFGPYMKKLTELVALQREKAEALGYKNSPYDALLDDYEPGMTVKKLDKLFADLRNDLVPLVKAIQGSKVVVNSKFRYKTYPKTRQFDLIHQVLEKMGYDFKRGR